MMRSVRSWPVMAVALIAVLARPYEGQAQKKELLELQRTVADLENTVGKLKQSQDERLIELKLLVQQALENSNKASAAVTFLENRLKEQLAEQQKTIATPVAGIGSKMDSLADEFRFVRENINDLNTKLGRLENKVVDVEAAVKLLANPPAPPPAAGTSAQTGPPPGVSSETLFQQAYRDKLGNNVDLALTQFQDYVNWFPETTNACLAQYFVGEIHYGKNDFEKAVTAFDAVLEKYPETCSRVPDAHYTKGQALAKLGQKTSAGEEFRELKRKFPTGPWTTKANVALKELGLSTTAPATGGRKKK